MLYNIDNRDSKRIVVMRAICLLMVIYQHQFGGGTGLEYATGTLADSELLNAIMYIISRIVSHFAVPLFFLISSLLLYRKEFTWRSNMKKKLKTLIIPYIIWVTIYIVLYFIGQTIPATAIYFANPDRLVRNMSAMDFIGAYTGIANGGLFVNAIWFLRDLIIYNLLASVIKKVVDKFPSLIFMLLVVLWIAGSSAKFLGLNTQGIVFFTLGYYIVLYEKKISIFDRISLWQAVVVFIITVALEYSYYLEGETLTIALHAISTIFGILIVILISGKIISYNSDSIPKIISIIAEYSFFVYVSHDFVQTIFKKLATKILPNNDFFKIIEFFSIPLIVCGVCIIGALLMRKSMPKVYNVVTGSRKQVIV